MLRFWSAKTVVEGFICRKCKTDQCLQLGYQEELRVTVALYRFLLHECIGLFQLLKGNWNSPFSLPKDMTRRS